MINHPLRTTLRLCGLLIALIAGLALALPAEAATTWSDPQPLDDEFARSWFPEISADPTGAVRVVWEGLRDPRDPGVTDANGSVILLAERESDGWTEPAAIQVKDVFNAGRPIIASDGRYVHIIARGLVDRGVTGSAIQNLAGLYYIRAPANADLENFHSWSEPIRLSNGASYWAQLVVLPNSDLVVVYNQLVTTSTTGDEPPHTMLFSRRSEDDGVTWSPPVRISSSEQQVARSSLAVSPVDGSLVLVWDEGYDNLTGLGEAAGIQTANSIDGGASWSEARKVGDGDDGSWSSKGSVEQSTVATNGELTVLVYRAIEQDILLYRTSTDLGTSWSAEAVIPDAVPRPYGSPHHFDKLSLVVDAGGQATLAFAGADPNAPDGLSIIVTSFEGTTWSRPVVVAAPNGFPEYPRLSVALGNELHLTYVVRDQQSEGGRYVIWVAKGESDAATVAPASVTPPESSPTHTPGNAVPTLPELAQLPDVPPAQDPVSAIESTAGPRSTLDNPIVSALRYTALTLPIALILVVGARRALQTRF